MPSLEQDRPPDAANVNMYCSGQHSVGWHADDEPLFDAVREWATILSLSLGETRTFQIKAKSSAHNLHTVSLKAGDLLAMHGLVQRHYLHQVPRCSTGLPVGIRINITWRWVKLHCSEGLCPLAS